MINSEQKKTASILFLGKAGDAHCQQALQLCRETFSDVESFLGQWGEPLPEKLKDWHGDYIISYLSRWVVPEFVLKQAKKAAINFHPAPPEYPGIGCNNFALYENASEYGVTCHHMASNVDTGHIIAVERFVISPNDTVESLLEKTYEQQFKLFSNIVCFLSSDETLPESSEGWTRRPFTRTELNELSCITMDMSKQEITRRIRATTFKSWKPTINLHGFKFELQNDE